MHSDLNVRISHWRVSDSLKPLALGASGSMAAPAPQLHATNTVTVRKGTQEDLPKVLQLIHELAEFEREADAVDTTVESMRRDGFGDRPVFEFFVAVSDKSSDFVGLALYFYSYSTWKGKCLYLEDLVVTESFRGKGLGRRLLDTIVQQARDADARRVVWQVLDWNKPAIGFYKSLGAEMPAEWLTCRLNHQQILDWQPKSATARQSS